MAVLERLGCLTPESSVTPTRQFYLISAGPVSSYVTYPRPTYLAAHEQRLARRIDFEPTCHRSRISLLSTLIGDLYMADDGLGG